MPSISHELRQAFYAGIQPCDRQQSIAGEQTSHDPLSNNESTRKRIFAACSLITYASPITLIALQGFDPKIRALQLTVWTLASLCIENTTEIIHQSFPLNLHSPTLSLIASQLEAQLLPLFLLQAALFIIFINQYHIHQPSEDTWPVILQHAPSAIISISRPYIIPGKPHPDELIRQPCPATNFFVLIWSIVSISSGICAYGAAFCYKKQAAPVERYMVLGCYLGVNLIRSPVTYLFHKSARSIMDRLSCKNQATSISQPLHERLHEPSASII